MMAGKGCLAAELAGEAFVTAGTLALMAIYHDCGTRPLTVEAVGTFGGALIAEEVLTDKSAAALSWLYGGIGSVAVGSIAGYVANVVAATFAATTGDR